MEDQLTNQLQLNYKDNYEKWILDDSKFGIVFSRSSFVNGATLVPRLKQNKEINSYWV